MNIDEMTLGEARKMIDEAYLEGRLNLLKELQERGRKWK